MLTPLPTPGRSQIAYVVRRYVLFKEEENPAQLAMTGTAVTNPFLQVVPYREDRRAAWNLELQRERKNSGNNGSEATRSKPRERRRQPQRTEVRGDGEMRCSCGSVIA